MTTTVAAWEGLPTLAASNAVGGIAIQTVWLVIGDLCLRRVNLEHSAASTENLFQGALLVALLSLPLIAMNAPEVSIFKIHPVSVALFILWWLGIKLLREIRLAPMWHPEQTQDTVLDQPNMLNKTLDLRRLWVEFLGLALVLGVCGYALAQIGSTVTNVTALSESMAGGLFTAASSSIPELVVVIAAVRSGAHTMAVSNIIGGNAMDTLFLVFADVAYREGSIYHAVDSGQEFFLVLTIFMTGILLMGLIRREREGLGTIGFEGIMIFVCYAFAIVALALV
jgi:cation:H+ antiporter